VPIVPQAQFEFDGVSIITDQRGVARVDVVPGPAIHTLRLANPSIDGPDGNAEFVRWWGRGLREEGYVPTITDLRVSRTMRIQVGFRLTYTVDFTFVDQSSDPIDGERISSMVLRNDAGQQETVPGRTASLVGVRPVVERGSLVAHPATYSVQSISVDGSNAVTAGEQLFVPGQQQDVTLKVPLRSVRFRAFDMFFGSPLGRSVVVTYPDGRTVSVPLDDNGEASVHDFVRGSYVVQVVGPGYAPRQPIELSRSQTVNLRVLSYLDVVILGLVAVLLLVGLLLARRRRQRLLAGDGAGP